MKCGKFLVRYLLEKDLSKSDGSVGICHANNPQGGEDIGIDNNSSNFVILGFRHSRSIRANESVKRNLNIQEQINIIYS